MSKKNLQGQTCPVRFQVPSFDCSRVLWPDVAPWAAAQAQCRRRGAPSVASLLQWVGIRLEAVG